MKKFGQVLTCIFVVFALIALVGCGVSKEDHEKVVSDLNKTKADLEKSKADLDKAKADLTQANSKAAALEKSLNEAKGQSEAKVAAAQTQAGDLQSKVDSLTKENADLQGMLGKSQSPDCRDAKEGWRSPGAGQESACRSRKEALGHTLRASGSE